MTPDGGKLAATPDEQKALEKLLAEAEVDQPGPPNRRPTLAIHSGLAADIDGDGKADHVFAGHDASALFGLVAVFLAKSPGTPVILEARMNDYPALVGTTDLDGDGAREVWVGGAFLEWIEDSVLTSGTSTRLVQLAGGKARAVGSWGCRRF